MAASVQHFKARLNIHAFAVKTAEVSDHIKDRENASLARVPVLNFEVEPMSVALSVGVNFEQQIVLVNILKVRTVQVTRFELRIKQQELSSVHVDIGWELRHDRCLLKLLGVSVKNEVVDVLSRCVEVCGFERFVQFTPEVLWVLV